MDARDYMASQIKALRKARGLSVDQLGDAIGKSGKTISAWEVGRGQPDADVLIALCVALDAHISDFYQVGASSDGGLSTDERLLLELYRSTDERGRAAIIAVANSQQKE